MLVIEGDILIGVILSVREYSKDKLCGSRWVGRVDDGWMKEWKMNGKKNRKWMDGRVGDGLKME